MRNSALTKLNPCTMCGKANIQSQYLEKARYKYVCPDCGQYFELNAPSQMAADLIYNYHIAKTDPIRAAGGCRCGECMYWDGDGRCEPPENGLIREYTKPTDFCSYGEPREAQDDA